MKAVVCAGVNNCIGKDNQLVVRISEDLRRFRNLTIGHDIIMGRKTYESLPKPLPNRVSHVLTRTPSPTIIGSDHVVHFHSDIDEVLHLEDAFIIGGGQIYELMLPYCDTVYMTRVLHDIEGDTYFPVLNEPIWRCVSTSIWRRSQVYTYRYELYTRR